MSRFLLLLALSDIAEHFGMNCSHQFCWFDVLFHLSMNHYKSTDSRLESVMDRCNYCIYKHIIIDGNTSYLEAILDLDHLIEMLVDLGQICALHCVEFSL